LIKIIKKIIKKNFTKQYWKSDLSSAWHNKRSKDKDVHKNFEIFENSVINKIKHLNYDTVIEIGTGAGELITQLSKSLHSYRKFIGVDINKKQIKRNKEKYFFLSNVEFVHMGFEKYITVNHLNNAVIVSQNTLDYFKENELKNIFLLIHSQIENVAILISGLKSNVGTKGSVDREDADLKVYHHDYYSLLVAAGYEHVDVTSIEDGSVLITGSK
jgi:hypothetical protein